VTYDPRGVERSVKADPTSESTPQQHADDLHRIIGELGSDPVDIFASSGGAVNALALVAAHPEDVRTLVAHGRGPHHRPDREARWPRARPSVTPTSSTGSASAWRFILVVGHQGR
jgi:pimeloyl-ACP methyl ester carboxylesterase